MAASKRNRTARRQVERAAARLVRARESLFALEPGGSFELPVVVESASEIEPHAESMMCSSCGDHLHVADHRVVHRGESSVRLIQALSRTCGKEYALYFAIRPALPN